MPESRACNTTETPCRLDDLPPPSLMAADDLASSEKPILTKTAVRETTETRETAKQTTQTNEAQQTGKVVDYSRTVDNSRKLDNWGIVEGKSEISYKLKTVLTTNPSTMEIHKAKTELPMAWFKHRYPVAVSENDEKPTIVTSKRPFDSFCSGSLFPHRLSEIRPADIPMMSAPPNVSHTSTPVTNSSVATANSPTLARNTASLPPRSQSPSTSTSSSSTSPSTSSTNPSTSSGNLSSSASDSDGSARTSCSSMLENKKSSQRKPRRKGTKREKHETRRSEDVDNYMGNKPIDELLRFIEK